MRRHALPFALVMTAAVLVRVLVYGQIADGPALHLQAWSQSDMHFFDRWARHILDGDVLTAHDLRPYHGRHRKLACAALALSSGDTATCDERAIVATWDEWVGHSTFWQDPLYPYALAGLYAAFGRRPMVAYLANLVLGLGSVALVFAIAARLGGGAAAVLGGLLAAAYGPLLFYETLALRETAITFFGLATVAATMVTLERAASGRGRGWRWPAVAAGVLAGASILLKSSFLVFVAAMGPVLVWWFGRDRIRAAGFAAAFLAGVVLACAPLVARNVAVGVPAFELAATGPLNFLNGNAADRRAGGGSSISVYAPAIMARTGGDGAAVVAATLATHERVSDWVRLLAAKFIAFWHWREAPNNANYYYFRLQAWPVTAVAVAFPLVAPLALVGLPFALRRTRLTVVPLAYVASGIAVCTLFYNLSRFRLPIAVTMAALAGCGLVSIAVAVRDRDGPRAARRLIAACLIALLVRAPWQEPTTLVRIADHGVAGEIAVHLARREAAAGRIDRAIAIIERQLATEPAELERIEPGPEPTRVSVEASAIAGVFAPIHALMAELEEAAGRPADARRHLYRAEVLRRLNAPYAAIEESG